MISRERTRGLIARARDAARLQTRMNLDPDDTPRLLKELANALEDMSETVSAKGPTHMDPKPAEPTVVLVERAVVYHDFYGCDTGCCGHSVVIYRGTEEVRKKFYFEHPWQLYKAEDKAAHKTAFAQRLLDLYNREYKSAAVLDPSSCEVSDD